MGHDAPGRWYKGITRYQWLVLVIASLGWLFDVFEGQIFVASMSEVMADLVPDEARGDIPFYNQAAITSFLVGGALGGVFFGWLSDRIGRVRTMVYTIVMYSLFTCLSALSQTWWHVALLRFLVALGVGGEWAVAAALVAEVFPRRARAHSLAIFHASSVLGTFMAVAAGIFIIGNASLGWRWGFVLGAAPALLVIWIRLSLHETPKAAQAQADVKLGIGSLRSGRLLGHTLLGVGLAAVGLATFWGTHIYGKNTLRRAGETELRRQVPGHEWAEREPEMRARIKDWEMTGMFLVTGGGGLGLFCFGPLAELLGRRRAFLFYHAGGFVAAVVLFQALSGTTELMLFLPVFGFLTLGMHAGYAVYFPELFPTALRGTAAGICFNFGRLVAAPIQLLSGWLQRQGPGAVGMSLEDAATLLSCMFLLGIPLLIFAPETRGIELPE
jgi:MFS family permease